MNHDQQDNELRQLFQTLRPARERGAGRFSVPAATRSVRRPRPRVLTLSLAAVLPVLLAVVVYVQEFGPAARERRALRVAAELIAWRAPTDTLLHNAYAGWQRSTPSLGFEMPSTQNQEQSP